MPMPSSLSDWPAMAELLTHAPSAPLAWLGAPLGKGSVTPGQCHRAPETIRKAMARISTYDVESDIDLASLRLHDGGDLPLENCTPFDSFQPIFQALSPLVKAHALSLLIGGNNAITRPGLHALDPSLQSVGLLTLDAHFDLRSTDQGLINGNPVRALLEDGLPGTHIAQVGLAPFANSKAMFDTAQKAGIRVYTQKQCRETGLIPIIDQALSHLSQTCDSLYVDFDIDVIERALSPGAPGGRAGGLLPTEFFTAARHIASHPKVRVVDLTEFDPSLDINQTTALIAARWLAEIAMGYMNRAGKSP